MLKTEKDIDDFMNSSEFDKMLKEKIESLSVSMAITAIAIATNQHIVLTKKLLKTNQ